MNMPVEIIRGERARHLLSDDQFAADWSSLCEKCPWATAFQSPAFVATWYRAYRERAEPVLVTSRESGRLRALLPLAYLPSRKQLAVAGTWHAEYHAWVCPPPLGDAFPAAAFPVIRREFPRHALTFLFLPPGAPTAWIGDRALRRRSLIKERRRPLMQFGDGHEIAASLAKSANKSRLKRLEKIGPVAFERITDPAEFEPLFDQIIRFYDARRLAVSGSAPFQNDPLKRTFHLEMMRAPDLLHVTVMKVGDQIASAHLGACGRREVQLGLVAHNPEFEKHSPGKFHILFLARMLLREGYVRLDLTAGGDPYKERFANAWDQVQALRVFPTATGKAAAALAATAEQAARKTLDLLHVSPARARWFVNTAKRPRTLAASFVRRTAAWFVKPTPNAPPEPAPPDTTPQACAP